MNDLPIVFTREELKRHDQRIIEALAKEADSERDRSDSVLRIIGGIDIPAHRLHWRRVGNWLRDRAAAFAAPVDRCTTPGCPGDYRYASPGRGHIPGCQFPAPPVEQP